MALRARTVTAAPQYFDTGLEGVATFTVQVVDSTNATVIAPVNIGISEFPTGSACYSFTTGEILNDRLQYKVIWHDSVAGFYAYEDILPLFPSDLRIPSSIDDPSPLITGFNGASNLSDVNDFYLNMLLVFTSGDLTGIPRKVTGYVGATRSFSFTVAFPAAPSDGDQFDLIGLGD